MASPYPERHNRAMADYLRAQGFEIVRAEGMDVPFKRLQSVAPVDIKKFIESVLGRSPPCDAIYLPCPQWQAAQTVDALERDIGIPVIAYSHACFFVAFNALGIKEPIRGHGRLLACLSGSTP
jgi:maleate cis-trans isomerase